MAGSKNRLLKLVKIWKNSYYDARIPTLTSVDKGAIDETDHKIPKGIRTFFQNRGELDLLNNVPKEYTRRTSLKNYCVIVEPKIARRIGHVICSRFDGNYLIESDPGFGYMSSILVTSTPHLRLCEMNSEFRTKLEVFKSKHEGKVEIYDINFFLLIRSLTSRQSHLVERREIFFDNLPERSWKDAPNISFIFTTVQKQLIRTVCRRIVLDNTLLKFGRSEFYCLIPTHVYRKLIATPDNDFKKLYRSTAVLFQTVFDFEVLLDGLPTWAILPWPSKVKKNKAEDMILLRAVPKINFFETFKNRTLIRSFFSFINENMRKNKRVISSLENYVANCGPIFIVNYNLTSYSEFMELPPNIIISLFLQLSELPSFKHSALYMSSSIDDGTDDENDSEDENT